MSSEVKQSQKSYLEEIFDMFAHAIYIDDLYGPPLVSVDIFYECTHWTSDRREELIHDMQELFN